MKTKNKNILKCPCCKIQRRSTEMKLIVDFISKSYSDKTPIDTLRKDIFGYLKDAYYDFACDVCLESDLAFLANIKEQNNSHYNTIYAYYNSEYNCRTCNTDFIFYGKEKRFWYEVLKFRVDSKPMHCVSCRKENRSVKNMNTRLSDLLINGEENLSLDDFEEIIAIYTKWEKVERRKYFENKLKKIKK